jgi:hypothetical protein
MAVAHSRPRPLESFVDQEAVKTTTDQRKEFALGRIKPRVRQSQVEFNQSLFDIADAFCFVSRTIKDPLSYLKNVLGASW